MTMHRRCEAFRGESNDSSKLLFSVKKSAMLQRGVMRLDVFLANNREENVCDFRVIVPANKSSCNVYVGESSTIVATVCTITCSTHQIN